MPNDKSIEIPPAIGIAVEEKFEQADRMRQEAERVEALAKQMLTEYGLACQFLSSEDQKFRYTRERRKMEHAEELIDSQG